jgi:3'(2'), 5'-bisphosphate nucleotidase
MDTLYRPELLAATSAIQRAATLSLALLAPTRDKGTTQKHDLSPVTVADFAIQALLTAALHASFPADGFVGEESAADLRADDALCDRVWGLVNQYADVVPRSKEEMCEMIDWCGLGVPVHPERKRVWVFDPIDGTKTFVEGKEFAINVALLEGGRQVLGVVACPTWDAGMRSAAGKDTVGTLLFAVKGHGAYKRSLWGSADEVEVRRLDCIDDTYDMHSAPPVTSVYMADSGVEEVHSAVHEKLGIKSEPRDVLAWVLRWALLALSTASMTVWVYKRRDRYAKVWDHAGAMLLYEEVGGKITDVDGKDIDLSVGRKMTANYGFVAAPRHHHGAVLKAVQEVLREQERDDLLPQ